MADGKPQILLVDDHFEEVKPLLTGLSPDFEILTEARSAEALATIDRHPGLAAVLLDLRFDAQELQGEELLGQIKTRYPGLPVIVLTALSDVALALRLVHGQRRAHYYFVKEEVDPEQLAKTVENAVGYYRLSVNQLRMTDRGPIVGSSLALEAALRMVAKAAADTGPVLMLGESGTGKELFARAIHLASDRRSRPFIAVNCAAFNPELLASELFGTVKGAFTEARDRKGYFEQASLGTLFLDEVAELPLASQAVLLRAAESGEIQRVGGKMVSVDVRLITATNLDLEAAVRAGKFRQDLYYRLATFPISLPALRDRPEDIPALIEHLLARDHPSKSLSPEAVAHCQSLPWPGNVRELRNVLNRAARLSDEDVIDRRMLEQLTASGVHAAPADPASGWVDRLLAGTAGWEQLRAEFRASSGTLRDILDAAIRQWRSRHGHRPSGDDLAELLGTNRNHVNQLLKQLDLKLRDYD